MNYLIDWIKSSVEEIRTTLDADDSTCFAKEFLKEQRSQRGNEEKDVEFTVSDDSTCCA